MTTEKFWALTALPDTRGCRVWLRARNACGYGILSDQNRPWLAHRWIWTQMRGAIPEGHGVCHHCDVRPCCTLDHLFLGTQADNMGDAAAKGRMFVHHGILHGKAILNDDVVQQMLALHAAGVRNIDIARRFGVDKTHAWAITHRRIWTHVEPTSWLEKELS